MKQTICIALILIFIAAGTISSTCDSPVVGDHSGAPGETNCSGCHSSPVNPDLPDLHFEMEGNDTSYVPGNTYLVHVSIKKTGHDKFGFVCSSLDTLNLSKGTFDLINTTTTRKYSMGGRNYISHTPCGADSLDKISWTFNWTAPSSNKGKITIYMSMLVADHNHALSGDTTYTRQISLTPSTATLTNEVANQSTRIYPNPWRDVFNVCFGSQHRNDNKVVTLVDVTGVVKKEYATCDDKLILDDISALSSGVYFLKIRYQYTNETITLMKQ